MTEDEAKTKWCPHVRLTATGDPVNGGEWSTNRADQEIGLETVSCIGSECMAWRRFKIGQHQESCGPQGGYKTVVDYEGYCGLAGKP